MDWSKAPEVGSGTTLWDKAPAVGGTPPTARQAQDIGDAIFSGLQSSTLGLAFRRKLPDVVLGEETPWYARAAGGVAGVVADLPASVVGVIPGAALGTAAGGPVGGIVGAGAGAFAVPMAIREALTEAYTNNNAASWQGVVDIALAGLKGAGKGAVIGGATAGAGSFVARGVGAAIAPGVGITTSATGARVAITGAETAAELATLVTTSAALEGHMPTWQDFMDNAILLGGMKGAVALAPKLRGIFAQTGRRPEQVVADAMKDPAIALDLKPVEPPNKAEPMVEAWHGSPHTFEKFDLSKIGTGEGAQAFGHGLYFAENPGVAKSYADALGGGKNTVSNAASYARTWLDRYSGDRGLALQALESLAKNNNNEIAAKAAELVRQGFDPRANLYRVEIPQRVVDSMLDWDKPLSAQPDILAKLRKAGYSDSADTMGGDFIRRRNKEGLGAYLSEDLAKAGVTGVRYLDATSRGAGAGTQNYVLFSAEHARVVERNGKTIASGPEPDAIPRAYAQMAINERVQAALGADPRPELIREAAMGPDPAKPAAKPLAWEYVTSGEEAAALLRETMARYGTEVEAQRRGVVTNAQTLAEAEALLRSGAGNRPREIGDAASAAETVMRAALVRDAVRHSTEELAKLSALRPEQLTPETKLAALAAIERLAGVSAEYAGVRAEWGRAGQMMREMKYNRDVLVQAEAMVGAFERKMPLQEIAALARQLKDNPDALIEFSQGALKATTKEKVIEAWRASIFSGPLTWQANILGNVGKLGVEMSLEAPISAAVYAMQQKAAGKPLAGVQVRARAFAPLYGLKLAVLDGLHLVRETKDLIDREGVGAAARRAEEAIQREHDRIDVVGPRANEGAVGKFVGFSFGALKLQDMPFRNIAERAEAYIRAVDRAVAEKYDPRTQEFATRVAQLVRNPTEGLTAKAAADVLTQIEQAGAEGVFGQRLGPRMERLSGAMSGTLWEFVFPARRTPVNLLDWAVQHVPGGNFVSSRWKADWAAGGERRADAIARQAVGAILATMAVGLVESGMLTGGGLMEKEEGRTKSAAGWQPYSVKIDGQYYSIARIEPIAKLFQLVGDMAEIYDSPKTTPEDQAKALAMIVLAFGNATVSTTYMSGLSNLMRAVLDPQRYGATFVEQYAASLVPKIVGQTVVLSDEYKREVDGALEAIQAQTPFLREKLLPARDVWGEPVKNERLFSVVPVAQTAETTSLVKSEAVRLQLAISDVPKSVTEKGPFKPGERQVRLDAMQRDVLREVSGKQAMATLTPIVNSPDWKRIPDFAQAAIYRKVISSARTQGALVALPPDAAARLIKQQQIVDETLRQLQEAQTR